MADDDRRFDRLNAGERFDPGPSTYSGLKCEVCGREFAPGEMFEGHVDWDTLRACPGGRP